MASIHVVDGAGKIRRRVDHAAPRQCRVLGGLPVQGHGVGDVEAERLRYAFGLRGEALRRKAMLARESVAAAQPSPPQADRAGEANAARAGLSSIPQQRLVSSARHAPPRCRLQ